PSPARSSMTSPPADPRPRARASVSTVGDALACGRSAARRVPAGASQATNALAARTVATKPAYFIRAVSRDSPNLGLSARSRGERLKRRAVDAHDGPFVHRPRPERPVEADRRRVPVKHPPLEPRAAALDRDPRKLGEKRLAESEPARLGPNEEVLEVDPWPTLEGREVVKEQRKAHRRAIDLSDQHFGVRARAEQLLAERGLVEADLVRELLVLGQRADQLGDQGKVVRRRRADRKRHLFGRLGRRRLGRLDLGRLLLDE